jgi:hypothetical protein
MLPEGESTRSATDDSTIFRMALPLQSLRIVSESPATKSSFAPSER